MMMVYDFGFHLAYIVQRYTPILHLHAGFHLEIPLELLIVYLDLAIVGNTVDLCVQLE